MGPSFVEMVSGENMARELWLGWKKSFVFAKHAPCCWQWGSVYQRLIQTVTTHAKSCRVGRDFLGLYSAAMAAFLPTACQPSVSITVMAESTAPRNSPFQICMALTYSTTRKTLTDSCSKHYCSMNLAWPSAGPFDL